MQGLMAAGSSSPGTSPSGLGVDSVAWAAMRQQQQQQQQQHQQAAQLGQAQRIHAALIATPGLQHVTLEQVRPPASVHCSSYQLRPHVGENIDVPPFVASAWRA